MAKKKPLSKALLRRQVEPALSGIGVGSLVRIVLLAALGIGGAVVALWVHYRYTKPYVPAVTSASASASDGIQYIEIDVDASVLP